jgi:predicted nucleic acid-binding protein
VIVLDTNVLSELMKPEPSKRVASWIARRSVRSLYVTSVTQAEILYGILLMPSGRKRRAIEEAAVEMFDTEFARRVLPFGSDAAVRYARIAADRRMIGRPISHFDAQIAAITAIAGASLATRNVDDFAQCGIDVVNPWEEDG